ncbi:hypothetical protein B6E78_15840 [Edwardsiella ictaluri]|nr:hypothetical protein B6E78_15840 [Edwardsiella ictaluri]
MQHRLMVFGLLFPSDQDPAKALHPTMRLEAAVFDCLRRLSSRRNMRFVTTYFQTNFQPFGIIPFVQPQRQPAAGL